jgi:magnesium transporter
MITHYFRTVKDTELKQIEAPRTGVWTHVVSPTSEEIEQITKDFALDRDILEDARDFFEVPRHERSGGVNYFFTRFPFDKPEEGTDTAPLLIVAGESFIVTIALTEVPQFDKFFAGKEVVITTQKAKFFIQLMEAVTVSFERKLVGLRKAVNKDRVGLRQIGNRGIVRLVDYENELNDLITAIVPTNAWLQQVTAGNFMQLYNEDVALMHDLMIANSQMVDSARSVLKTVQNIRGASEAILTNNLNASIRTLTVLTIILTIPTIVASLYGMNIELPLSHHPYAFYLVLVFVAMVVSLVVWAFRRNKWL